MPENPLFENLTAARRKGWPLRAFSGGRCLPAAFLRLTPAQIFAQFGSQALTAAVRFLVFAGLLIFHRGGIIGLLPGVATLPPSPCVTGNRVAVSAAFYAAASGGHAHSRCRSSVVEHPLGKGEVVCSIHTGSTTHSTLPPRYIQAEGPLDSVDTLLCTLPRYGA